jgi:hypothetical protein
MGGALAWVITATWTDASALRSTSARLDILVAMTLGACTGALVLLARARHRRDPLLPALGRGLVLGGVPAMLAAALTVWLGATTSAIGFVAARVLVWACVAALSAGGLAWVAPARARTVFVETLLLGALGGAVGGAMASLPGPTELWLPLAMAWTGAAIGFAGVGPLLWRAPVVVHVLAARNVRRTMWSLHERAVDVGTAMVLAEARLECNEQGAVIHPPPGGAVLDGYPVYRVMPVQRDALLAVGRSRFRLTVEPRP